MNTKNRVVEETKLGPDVARRQPSAEWLLRDLERTAYALYWYALQLLGKPITPVQRFELMVRSELMYDAMDRAQEVVGHRQECRLTVRVLSSCLLGDFELPVLEMIADEAPAIAQYLKTYRPPC